MRYLIGLLALLGVLSACGPADPALVDRAVSATLAVWPTQTPVVVVVTVPVPMVTVVTAVPPASATPAPPSATPSALPALTATATPSAPAALTPSGELLFSDDFSQNLVWNVADLPDQVTRIEDGALHFTIKRPDRFGILFNTSRRASNFEATVRARPAAPCATRDRYGLLFRVQAADAYYQFEVDCEGRYRLAVRQAETFTLLQDWISHPAITPGGDNELYVRAVGASIQLGVNAVPLAAYTDSTLSEGGFGFYAGSGLRAGLTALFDDLRVFEVK